MRTKRGDEEGMKKGGTKGDERRKEVKVFCMKKE
jgi:hypothetical protein